MDETLRQFSIRRVREIASEYGITQVEVRRCYDERHWSREWWDVIGESARSGAVIPTRTLDALDELQRYHLMHDYRASIPGGYLPPEVREQNRRAPRLFA